MSIFGLALSIGVLGLGLYFSSKDISIFFDPISLFIVIGGTLAATSVSMELGKAFMMIKIFFVRILRKKKYNLQKTITELIVLSHKRYQGASLMELANESQDDFLRESLQVISEEAFQPEEAFELLYTRASNTYQRYTLDALDFKSLGKYPPAFGMMGTTIGMIVLLANLTNQNAMKTIGPAMGICLITTLYGVIISNLFIIPIGENLEGHAKEINQKNEVIVHGIAMILKKENPIIITEHLNSYLLPGTRLDWSTILK